MRLVTRRKALWFSIAAILISTALTAGANGPAIDALNDGNRVIWTASTAFETATLTVGLPGGTVVERVFAADEAISFSPVDLEEIEAADGLHTWQIVLSPVIDAETREILDAARLSGTDDAVETLRQRGQLPAEDELVQSGSFRFVSRSLVSDDAVETRGEVDATKGSGGPVDMDDPTRAQVIVTDLVVQGSECVGLDCVNGESFGFDTIRLKENNLRIHFQDTSNSASFPATDWRIVANDSSNGGANYLAIEDSDSGRQVFKVTAGAPANSLLVDAAGDVGLGTSNPVVELHVADGDTPTVRLEQNGSSGFTPQTWDMAGNESNFFIRDVTNGSRLSFRIRAGAPENSIFVDTDGDIGFGTASPDSEIDIEGSGPGFRLTNTGSVASVWDFRVDPDSGRFTVTDDATNVRNPFKIGIGADNNLLKIGTNDVDRIDINGRLFINGVDNSTPDYVFEPNFKLESIEEHAESMWRNKHLPALNPAEVGEDGKAIIDVANRSQGVLEELEKAHIYIQQLHERIELLSGRLDGLVGASE